MHLTRSEATTKLPIPRKGTKYLARAASYHRDSVPVTVAVRDMLKLARTNKEVKYMIHKKLLKINGKEVKDFKESIKLMSLFEADKKYKLTYTPAKKFAFEESKDDTRLGKIIGKKMLAKKKIQFNLHDGTNILSDKELNIGDSLELTMDNKIKHIISMKEKTKVLAYQGKSLGKIGEVVSIANNKIKVKMEDGIKELDKKVLFAIK